MSKGICCSNSLENGGPEYSQMNKKIILSSPDRDHMEPNPNFNYGGNNETESFTLRKINKHKAQDVPRFVVFGKPCMGKTTLSRRLCDIWNCVYVNATYLIKEHINCESTLGNLLVQQLVDGRDLEDIFVLNIVKSKICSTECQNKGYILDDLPTNSGKQMSIDEQFEIILNLDPQPNCFILLEADDCRHRTWWESMKIDPESGLMVSNYKVQSSSEFEILNDHTIKLRREETFTPDSTSSLAKKTELLVRIEEQQESLDKHFYFYNNIFRPKLEAFFQKTNGIPIIRICQTADEDQVFQDTVQALYLQSINPKLANLDLFGEFAYTDMDTDEIPIISTKPVRRSKWQKLISAFKCNSYPDMT